ncbi:hypothetical protein [Oceaniserpentilla sp. 4NH20-0058]|uniref:hypothetical protein n=1 Tax=Oceaniserpentilla sp. 4NH20-0058 TaxID=3127660 RepID=UPI0033424008
MFSRLLNKLGPGAALFAVITYFEFAVVALISLYYTYSASEHVLASSSVTFLIISYGMYLALGIHNGVLRDTAIEGDEQKRARLLAFEILFSVLLAAVMFISSFIVSDLWWCYGLLVASANQLKTGAYTIFRISKNDRWLNVVKAAWVFMFCVSFFLCANFKDIETAFFASWCFSLYIVMLPALFFGFYKYKKEIKVPVTNTQLLLMAPGLIKSSGYIFLAMLGVTGFVTFDRLWLNTIDLKDDKILAQFQFFDVWTNIFFLGVSTIIFYFTPDLLKSYSLDEGRGKLLDSVSRASKVITVLALLFIVFSLPVLYLIERYSTSGIVVLASMTALKSLLLIIGFFGNYLIANHKERLIVMLYFSFLLLLMIGASFLFPSVELIYIPTFVAVSLMLLLFLFKFLLVKGKF